MALYLGSSEKLRVNLGNAIYVLNLNYAAPQDIDNTLLLSSDGHILKDKDGLYLVPREEN